VSAVTPLVQELREIEDLLADCPTRSDVQMYMARLLEIGAIQAAYGGRD
jgi:hypothetical protein